MGRGQLAFHNVKVSTQRLIKHRVPKQAAFGDVTHEKFYYYEQLVYGLVETRRKFGRWCSADRLLQVGVCRTVVELHGLDAAKIVVVAGKLRVRGGSREIRFRDEFVGLVVKAVMEVTAEKTINEGCLGLIIVAERSSALGREE
jgi:hypothetical protein